MTSARPPRFEPRGDARMELLAALLLSAAALASAWSAYQASCWNGVQTVALAQANTLRAESVRAENRALQQTQIDVGVFVAWVQSRLQKNTAAADFIQARFRREFVPAFDAWAGTRVAGEVPPGTPFQRPEYQLAAAREAERLAASAQDHFTEAERWNHVSDNFIFAVVLFTSAIFFAGFQSKVSSLRIRAGLMALGLVLMVGGLLFMVRLPQTLRL